MPLVDEVANASSGAELRNDVQLAQFRSEKNLELAREFIFTRKAAAGRKSSTELLKLICEAYMGGSPPNRFVFIATYGHGKSHFAVATANYFGKASDGPESNGVLARLQHALQDASLFGFFEGFKRNHKPFLVLVLQGDEPSDLQTKFFRAVEDGLRADGSQLQAPFWYIEAERFVDGILKDGDSLKQKAESFLSRQQLDLNLLLERIRHQDASSCDVTRDLCVHLYHYTPDFGAGLSLKDAVEWLGKNAVGDDKPYGGILILFDEFSSFVRDYAIRIQDRPGAPLQDLLNGVDVMRGKVAFVALAQRDPELVAKNLLNGDSLQSLTTQLNRLPKPQHYQLHSSLEEVLAAYLKQEPSAWTKLYANRAFGNQLGQASDLCFDIFTSRYSDTLEWDIERFQEVVTKGCFPLHPATTALLSSVELETTSNPRSVLGFVSKHLHGLRGVSAFEGGRPSWVLPISLVDYFKEMLGEKVWNDYIDALGQAGGPDASPEQAAVLKAMLLQTAGKVATHGTYNRVIAHFAGLSLEHASTELKSLASAGVIRFDPAKSLYTFWPAGKGANKVDQILAEKLNGTTLDSTVLNSVNAQLKTAGLLSDLPITVPWGHRDDWRAEQVLATKNTFTTTELQKLILNKMYWRPEAGALARGIVVWLVAEDPEEATYIRDAAASVLGAAFPDQDLPVLLMKPFAAQPEFVRQLLRLYGLSTFSSGEIAEVGKEQYSALQQLTTEALIKGFKDLAEGAEQEVAVSFRGRIKSARFNNAEDVLAELYKMAYRKGPRRWFDQYRQNSPKLKNSTSRVITHLLKNSLNTPGIFDADSLAKDIAQQQIKSEWALLVSDLRIKQPLPTAPVYDAWQTLEKAFPAGGTSRLTAPCLTELLNAPFGYDFNTLSLVFAAWIGFHRHDLELSLNGQLQPITLLANQKPNEFLELLARISIRKTDADIIREQIRSVLQRVERGSFSQIEAREALHLCSEALERDDVDQKQVIQDALSKLSNALKQAEDYDLSVDVIERVIEAPKSLLQLSQVINNIRKLSFPEAVKPDRAAPAILQSRTLDQIKAVVEAECIRVEQLKSISSFDLNKQKLDAMQTIVEHLQLSDVVKRVNSAMLKLQDAKQALEQKQQDEASLAVVQEIATIGPLAQLKRSLLTLERISLFAAESREMVAKKETKLRDEIARLTQFAQALPQRLSVLTDLDSLGKVQNEILRHQYLFQESDDAKQVESVLQRSARLREFFESVEANLRAPLNTPDDVVRRVQDIKSVTAAFKESLSDAQIAVGARAIASLEHDAGVKVQSATKWLEDCERRASEKQGIDDLAASLARVPAFLSENLTSRLHALIEAVKQHTESKQLESATLSTLRAVSTRGSLADLRQHLGVVSGLPIPTDTVREEIERKVHAIQQEISRLEEYEKRLAERLDAATNLRQIELVQSDILRHQSLFDESDAADRVQSALNRSARLKKFFESLDAVSSGPIGTPDEGLGRIQELNAISASFRDSLAATQIDAAARCLSLVEQEIEKKVNAAIEWLEACEKDLMDSVDPEVLADRTKRDLVFLPVQLKPRLSQVIEKNNRRIDDDQILSVVVHFKKIVDPQKRQQCLQQIKSLMDESGT